jgi:hypothetical protein
MWKSLNQVSPGLIKMDTRAFPSNKQMGPEADHLSPSSTQGHLVPYLLPLHNLFT